MSSERGETSSRWGKSWLLAAERASAAVLLLTILGTMGAQVVARYVFHSPISWSEEWARFALIWLAFLSAAFVMAEGRHIEVDVVSTRMSPAGRRRLELLRNGVVVMACLLLLIGGFRFVWRVGLVPSPALGIPKSCWYGAASAGLGLIALHGVGTIVAALRGEQPRGSNETRNDDLPTSSGGAS
jgi:TRAP-type C4-dicarboxylate transport system permease small subunit